MAYIIFITTPILVAWYGCISVHGNIVHAPSHIEKVGSVCPQFTQVITWDGCPLHLGNPWLNNFKKIFAQICIFTNRIIGAIYSSWIMIEPWSGQVSEFFAHCSITRIWSTIGDKLHLNPTLRFHKNREHSMIYGRHQEWDNVLRLNCYTHAHI